MNTMRMQMQQQQQHKQITRRSGHNSRMSDHGFGKLITHSSKYILLFTIDQANDPITIKLTMTFYPQVETDTGSDLAHLGRILRDGT
jgi:hypothetical protein